MFEIMLNGRGKSKGTPSMFVGEVPAEEFITGLQLASAIGLVAGTPIADAGWLHFEDTVDGKTKYVSKHPLRHSISWDQLNAVGAVFGSKKVVIKGKTYYVRLFKGLSIGRLAVDSSGYDLPATHGSEWNRLMYHISKDINSGKMTSEGITTGDWASYSRADLGMETHGVTDQLCQEPGARHDNHVRRGSNGSSSLGVTYKWAAYSYNGWRPVLQLA